MERLSEWLKQRAWEANPVTLTEQHRNTPTSQSTTTYGVGMLLGVTL
jgi:hypothetical protein